MNQPLTTNHRRGSYRAVLAGILALLALLGAATSAAADPANSVSAPEVAATRWDGASDTSTIGAGAPTDLEAAKTGMRAVGDINGDGLEDIVVTDRGPGAPTETGGFYVLNSTANGAGTRDLADLQPSAGYRIMADQASFIAMLPNAMPIGDQNGDGTPEVMVSYLTENAMFMAVVYGVPDPSDLPRCDPPSPTRCIDPENMTDDQGYLILDSSFQDVRFPYSAGDFNDDGVEDIAVGATFLSEIYLIQGGARTETIDLADPNSLPAGQTQKLVADPENSYNLGQRINAVGDLNDDGFDDIAFWGHGFGGPSPIGEALWVLYGHAFTGDELDLTELDSEDGYRYSTSAGSAPYAVNIGDANGDGREDLAIGSASWLADDGTLSIMYSPENPPEQPILIGDDIVPGTGYVVGGGGEDSGLGNPLDVLGDFNNDGRIDLLASAAKTSVAGVEQAGAAYILFGQSDPEDSLEVGSGLTPELGLALVGSGIPGPDDLPGAERPNFGSSVAQLGDLDDDGLRDFAIGAEREGNNGLNASGSVYLILGKSLINQAKTGNANGIDNDSAVLNAGISTNDRATEVHFEYGTSIEYGQETPVQELAASNSGDSVSADITGLAKNTTYHYRAVATNELGLTRYGDDRTFTTTNTSGGGGSNCDTDNTLPGCSGYDHCKAKPADCQGSSNAKLSLISSPKTIKVKRGKKGSLAVIVVNSGGKSAGGVKVCVKVPKKLVKVKKCQSVGSLGSGATKTKTFQVAVKKKAKKGKKASLKFTASAGNAGSKTAKATVKVK